jgi:serine protease Do
VAFVALADDSGAIGLEAPAAWQDVSTTAWTRDGEEIGPSIAAAVDRPAWVEGWDTPGLFVGVTDRIGPEEAHGDFSGACLPDRTESISAGGYSGTGDWWWWCGDQASSFFVAVLDLGGGRVALLQILDSPEALPGVVERVLASFSYKG